MIPFRRWNRLYILSCLIYRQGLVVIYWVGILIRLCQSIGNMLSLLGEYAEKGRILKKWKCYAITPLSLASSTTFSENFNTVLEINLQWYKEMHFNFIIFPRFWEYHFTYPLICIFSSADAIPLKSNALNVSFYERIHTINLLLNFVMF